MIRFKQITEGFMEVIDRKQKTRVHMWHRRATQIDVFARWLVPAGYIIFLIMLVMKDRKGLEDIMMDQDKQMPLYMIGFCPIVFSLALYMLYGCFFMSMKHKEPMIIKITDTPIFRTVRTMTTRSKSALNSGTS